MGDNDPRSLPIFPSVIFIVAPILGITGLLCWATIQNRRAGGFSMRQLRQRDRANLLSDEDKPGLYEIWVDNSLKVAHEHLVGRDHPVQLSVTTSESGDRQSLCMLIQRPLTLKPASSQVLSSCGDPAEHSTVATLVRMPQNANSIGNENDPVAEVLIGTSPVRIMDTGESSEPKT